MRHWCSEFWITGHSVKFKQSKYKTGVKREVCHPLSVQKCGNSEVVWDDCFSVLDTRNSFSLVWYVVTYLDLLNNLCREILETEYWAGLTTEVTYHLNVVCIIASVFAASGSFFTCSLLLIFFFSGQANLFVSGRLQWREPRTKDMELKQNVEFCLTALLIFLFLLVDTISSH